MYDSLPVPTPLNPPTLDLLLIVHAFASAFMAGVIWIVQLVHYPLFSLADESRGKEFARSHAARITWVVAPAMLIELVVSAILILPMTTGTLPPALERLAWIGAALLVIVWISTFAVQVPLHGKLAEKGLDPVVVRRLVASNWVRTAAWSTRAILAAVMIYGWTTRSA